MQNDDSTKRAAIRQNRESFHNEPVRYWSTTPISEERAREIVSLLTNYDSDHVTDALIELICGLMPECGESEDTLNDRYAAGIAALFQAFTYTTRSHNEVGEYIVHLKVANWK
ncbi:MAG: hypothetical protein ICV60_05620 [Pyrinomonadaceae bacterium]|nr:hypothetical protein [Pyrinomonadaceae bacterium]